MHFEKLTIQDIPRVSSFFSFLRSRTCDFTVGGMFMWRDFYRMEYAIEDGTFYSRLFDEKGRPHYNLPAGPDIASGIEEIIRYEKQFSPVVSFCTIPEEYVGLFDNMGLLSESMEQDIYFDYLYSSADLKEFPGRRYSGQRNQISQFKRANEDWKFEAADEGNLEEVISFFRSSYHMAENPSAFEAEENAKTLEVLENYQLYGLHGGVLYSGNRIVGFVLGEIQKDTLYTHIEKADRNCRGAYQMLVKEFSAKYAGEGIDYINREEDMGDPGLRASKQSYHPLTQLKKYSIEVM